MHQAFIMQELRFPECPHIFFSLVALDELAIPKCMSDLKDKKAQMGGKTFFQMKVRGEPAPEVKW